MKMTLAVLTAFSLFGSSISVFGAAGDVTSSAPAPTLQINAANVTAKVSPILYGLMTEEINHSYDGGLYAEIIRNRSFQDDAQFPVSWIGVADAGANGTITLDTTQPLNAAHNASLKLNIISASPTQRVGIGNEGYWGIPIAPDTVYKVSFYAKANSGFNAPLTVALVSSDNQTVYAKAEVPKVSGDWQKYNVTLTTGKVAVTKDARFLIWTNAPGTVWFGMVSVFPPTYKDRPNGNRKDIMQLMADYKPGFLRFPGGNYVEGNVIANRFDWKKTIGDISLRPGHMDDGWNYYSTDGMGLLEFLEWCEDLHMQPLLAVYAGYSMREGAAQNVDPYVQDALDEIEYVTGNVSTTWGAQRAKDGHPEPFKLNYVEIGNEDNLGTGLQTYENRFAKFYDAIKAKYPDIKVIATATVRGRTPDILDRHLYTSPVQMRRSATSYDNQDRSGPKVMEGEYAAQSPGGNNRPLTPDLSNALGDAAYLSGIERNSDVVIMASYAPMFTNVNPGSFQWRTNMIGYDALTSYGSPSYYAQKMFNIYRGDEVLSSTLSGLPEPAPVPAPPAGRGGARGPQGPVPEVFTVVTKDSQTGKIYIKTVNVGATPLTLQINISGVASIAPDGQSVVLSSASPLDTNSITEPIKIAPIVSQINGLGTSFAHTFPANSITALVLQSR